MAYQAIGPGRSQAGHAKVYALPEAATQTLKAGAPVLRNAAGFMEECAADPTLLWGFAAEDGHNGATAGLYKLRVYRADQGVEFDGVAKGTLTQTMFGEARGLLKDASGIWTLDIAETTVDQCMIQDISSRGSLAADQVVEFVVLTPHIQEFA